MSCPYIYKQLDILAVLSVCLFALLQARSAPRTRTATTRNAAVVAEKRLASRVYSTASPQRAMASHMDTDEETEPVVVAAFPPVKRLCSQGDFFVYQFPIQFSNATVSVCAVGCTESAVRSSCRLFPS